MWTTCCRHYLKSVQKKGDKFFSSWKYSSPNLAFLESREMRDWGNKISRDCEISRDYISSTNIDSKIENKGFIFIFTRNFQNQLKILVLKLWFVKKNVLIIEIHVNLLIFCWKLDKNQGKNSISISQISHYTQIQKWDISDEERDFAWIR